MKSLLGSKTFWVNIVALVVAVLGLPEFANVLPTDNAQAAGVVAGIVAVANILLRLLTSGSITSLLPKKDV
jgi:hypothetical protein